MVWAGARDFLTLTVSKFPTSAQAYNVVERTGAPYLLELGLGGFLAPVVLQDPLNVTGLEPVDDAVYTGRDG